MNIDKRALREVAERATKGPWKVFSDIDTKTFSIHTPRDKRCENVIKWGGFDCQPNAEANAEFIAAFNPKVALALLNELEAARQHIAELESKNGYLRTIAHEQNELAIRASLDSNNATVEMGRLHKRIAELEAKLETADKLQDSAFRHGLQHGFSYGQTNDQAGFEQCMAAYSQKEKSNGC